MMRRALVTALLFLSGSSFAAPSASGETRFATALYDVLGQTPGNLFFSPASIRIALAMTYAGARGETASQMRTVLGFPEGNAAHEQIAALLHRWELLAKPTDTTRPPGEPELQRYEEEQLEKRRIALHVVNRVWAQEGHALRADYTKRLANEYHAPIAQLDFVRAAEPSRVAINQWVSEQTKKKIPQLLAPRSLTADTRLVLTNAIYFKASWQHQFEKSATQNAPFHAPGKDVATPFMRQMDHFLIARFEGGQLLELPYGAGDLAMDVILPTKSSGLPAVEKSLASGALPKWIAALSSARVDVSLPRWKSSAAFQLADALQKLGIVTAFHHPAADFSGIDDTRDLFISAVVHQAVVEVDEAGTEAAAATAVMMAAGGMPPSETPVPFRADHPFVYLIRDTKTGAILFLGRLADPS